MANQNPLHINMPAGATQTERTIINVLNQITDDMYDKKVKGIEQNIETNKEEALTNHKTNVDGLISANELICELAEAMQYDNTRES